MYIYKISKFHHYSENNYSYEYLFASSYPIITIKILVVFRLINLKTNSSTIAISVAH